MLGLMNLAVRNHSLLESCVVNIMSATTVKFDLSVEDSSDGESIFITQTTKSPSLACEAYDENVQNFELEQFMESSSDSAIGSVVGLGDCIG